MFGRYEEYKRQKRIRNVCRIIIGTPVLLFGIALGIKEGWQLASFFILGGIALLCRSLFEKEST